MVHQKTVLGDLLSRKGCLSPRQEKCVWWGKGINNYQHQFRRG